MAVPKSVSDRMLDMLELDPRFVALEPATIIVSLKLLRMMARYAISASSGEPKWEEMALYLRVSVDDLDRHRDALLACGLLRAFDGGMIGPPAELMQLSMADF